MILEEKLKDFVETNWKLSSKWLMHFEYYENPPADTERCHLTMSCPNKSKPIPEAVITVEFWLNKRYKNFEADRWAENTIFRIEDETYERKLDREILKEETLEAYFISKKRFILQSIEYLSNKPQSN
ncbi:MAG: hypothetical protein MHMPM18_000496 [Marteilia pararefringens]